MPIYSGSKQILTSGYGTGLTQKQQDANDRQKEVFTDGQVIKDAGGDTRLSFTDAGALLLKDESGNTGITLNTDQSTTFANSIDITNHITASGNISGSSTSTGSFGTVDLDSIQGNWTNAGNTVADLGTITTINIDGGTINGITDLAVADGGTGASTFTDGGILLGNGTGAIQATAVLTNGQMLVGDGTTDPAIESGATLRTSIGVGTTDNVAFGQITASGNISGSSISTGSFGRVETSDGSIFGNRYILSTQTIAAAGGDLAGATAIAADGGSTVFVTAANDAKGVRLPVVADSIIGQTFTIHNTVANKVLKVYPGSGDKILPAADNTAIEIAASCAVVVTHFSADGFVGYEPAVIVSD